jgi:hypothetical protein
MFFKALLAISLVSNVGALILQDPINFAKEGVTGAHQQTVTRQQVELMREVMSLTHLSEGSESIDPEMDPSNQEHWAEIVRQGIEKASNLTDADKVDLAKKLSQAIPKLPLSRTPKFRIKEGTGVPLKPGDKFALESEVQPGLFITWVGPGAQRWGEMGLRKRVDNSKLASFSTFSLKKADNSDIKSSEFVQWIQEGKQIDWSKRRGEDYNRTYKTPEKGPCGPFGNLCIIRHKKGFKEANIQLMHAKELDYMNNGDLTWEKSFLKGMRGELKDELTPDPREGQAIKDGDSVWIRRRAPLHDLAGPFYYLTGDPAEGYMVTFAHHCPGYDGYTPHINPGTWFNANDPHATSSRFTIRKV